MTPMQENAWDPEDGEALAGQFRRFGLIGFWIQLVLLTLSISLVAYVMLSSSSGADARRGIDLFRFAFDGGALVTVFTTYWCFRYTRLAPQTGVPIVAPVPDDPGKTVSAIDAMSLFALQMNLAAELMVLALSPWLLFRVPTSSRSIPTD